ncbi:MAG: hypothetical protein WBZ04_04755 [Candidatus Nanopelagicales bacterium]
MSTPTPELEAFIQFRLEAMAERNEHHEFEEVATRIARKRISSNILIANGPVSAGGDQQRDSESYTTHIPNELPHSAGFSACASAAPVVVACTTQRENLKTKVLADLAGICAHSAGPVAHVAFFSVHSIPEAATHELQKTAREDHKVTLDIFSGAKVATLLAEPDLVWVASHYLDLPSSMIPTPEGEPGPQWYTQLLDSLRRNGSPQAMTQAAQGEVAEGLRYATWSKAANADLPEWLDFMGAFLSDDADGQDTELVFRACYEMSVARFRGMGTAGGVEELIRRAIDFACASTHQNIVDDATTLGSYWGGMWASGVGETRAAEISAEVSRLRRHVMELLHNTDPTTHPVRAATLTGTLAYLHLMPDWAKIEEQSGQPKHADVAADVGVPHNEFEVDASSLPADVLVDLSAAMQYLDQLVDLLPTARAYSVRQLAQIFTMFVAQASDHPSYVKVRDALDTATATVQGDSAVAERCRDRAVAFVKADKPLEALTELHNAKINWYHGDTMYGAVLTVRFIAALYSQLGLAYAAKMYACSAAMLALNSSDAEVKTHVPKALAEAANYSHRAGCWIDSARFSEVAILARSQFLADPFDSDKHPELDEQLALSALILSAIDTYWPDLDVLIQRAQKTTGWYEQVRRTLEESEASYALSEQEFQQHAVERFDGPILGDLGPRRAIYFRALGVRWCFTFDNDKATVLAAEGLCATLQVFLADIARLHPVIIESTVTVNVAVASGGKLDDERTRVDDSQPEISVDVLLPHKVDDLQEQKVALLATCIQLTQAVNARPPKELLDLVETAVKQGLLDKTSVGRPYEEAAELFEEDHYVQCAAASRPRSSDGFESTEYEPLTASTEPGIGYDHTESLELIKSRYEVANGALRYTLPQILEDEMGRATIVRLRNEGWLDWQILAVLSNIAGSWRVQQAGMHPGVDDPSRIKVMMTAPEDSTAAIVPLSVFSREAIDIHLLIHPQTIAQGWDLHGRQERPSEGAMRDLLTRRYGFAVDDIPHTDLLNCVDETGNLVSIVSEDHIGPIES